MDYNVITAI